MIKKGEIRGVSQAVINSIRKQTFADCRRRVNGMFSHILSELDKLEAAYESRTD